MTPGIPRSDWHPNAWRVALLALGLSSVACPRAPLTPAARPSHYPTVVASFPSMDALRRSREWSGLESVIPASDLSRATCKPSGKVGLSEFTNTGGGARIFYLQYPGCCETRCRLDPVTREAACGRQLFSIQCAKDALVEGRSGRYAALAATSFSRFDPTAGTPKTRVFRFDLDADGTPEIVRWEELRQHHHTEWKVEAFSNLDGGALRRVADIRFYHAGPWRPDLNFSTHSDGRSPREIEIAVQDVDAARRVVVRRHIYRFDQLLKKYTMARTEVTAPPELNQQPH